MVRKANNKRSRRTERGCVQEITASNEWRAQKPNIYLIQPRLLYRNLIKHNYISKRFICKWHFGAHFEGPRSVSANWNIDSTCLSRRAVKSHFLTYFLYSIYFFATQISLHSRGAPHIATGNLKKIVKRPVLTGCLSCILRCISPPTAS